MTKIILLFSFLIFFSSINYAQQLISQEAEIDKIFEPLKSEKDPGVAACLIKNGEIIYLKSYGVANKDTGELIDEQTRFQLGELSKQFTTLAILILEKKGSISLSDDIRKYITELPEYKYTISINHLLNHTSGLYDINRIQNVLSGTMNIPTQSQALQLIAAQKALAFQPGTDFSFHEAVTESVLMAEIVARASGMKFSDFVKKEIFEPLQMKNSFIREDANSLASNVAQAFQTNQNNDLFSKSEVNSSVIGAINAYTSAEDLAKWYLNYSNPQGELGQLIQKLDTPVKLQDGGNFEYYWGKMAIGREFTHPERGIPIFWNYGFQGAYGTNVFRYLEQDVIGFVLGNNSQYNGGLAHDMVDVLVKEAYTLPTSIYFEAKNIQNLSTKELEKFVGQYWFKEGYASELFIENDTLRTKWLFGNYSQTLVPLGDDTFQQYAIMEDQRIFKFIEEEDGMTIYFRYNESHPDVMKRYDPYNPSIDELKKYEGTYFNANYSTVFTFEILNGKLVAKNIHHDPINLTPITKDVFTSTSLFFNALTFIKNGSDEVKGFSIITDGVHHLNFEKVDSEK